MSCRTLTGVLLSVDTEALVSLGYSRQNLCAVVRGSVINRDDLKIRLILIQQALNTSFDVIGRVVNGHDYAEHRSNGVNHGLRSEERSVGKECVSTCRSRGGP